MIECYKCAFKHISSAKVIYDELRQGYHTDPLHVSWFVGEMSCAAAHLIDKQPDMADAIRTDRIRVSDEILATSCPPKYLPEFDVYIKEVYRLMTPPELPEDVEVSILTK
jgi:hypothetical protein